MLNIGYGHMTHQPRHLEMQQFIILCEGNRATHYLANLGCHLPLGYYQYEVAP